MDSPSSPRDGSMQDEDDRVEWVERYFHKVPVNSRKLVYISPCPPHFFYTKDRQGRFICCTTANYLRPFKPIHLFTATQIDQCTAKPDHENDYHSHNTRGNVKECNSDGPTLIEIGLLYLKWAIREEAALATGPTSYQERTQIVVSAIEKLKSKGIPTPAIIKTTLEAFTVDSIQKSVESATKRAINEKTPFPRPSTEVLALDLWKSGWAEVEDSSESEQDPDHPVPSTSQERERSRSPRARRTIEEIFSGPVPFLGPKLALFSNPEPEEDTIEIVIKDGNEEYKFLAPKGQKTYEIRANKKNGYQIILPPPSPASSLSTEY